MAAIPNCGAEIGTVVSVNPARRELRVTPVPALDYEYAALVWVGVRTGAGQEVRCRVSEVRPRDGGWVVALVPGVPRDRVAGMRGATLVLAAEDRHPAPEGFFHVSELAGAAVTGADGTHIGTVVDAYEQPGNDVMEIDTPDGRRLLAPIVPELIVEFDRESGVVRVGEMDAFAVEGRRDDGTRR